MCIQLLHCVRPPPQTFGAAQIIVQDSFWLAFSTCSFNKQSLSKKPR